MPTPFTHAVAALALGEVYAGGKRRARFFALSVFCAVLPDVDFISYSLGVQRGTMFSHRGITHSLAFALLLALLVVTFAFREAKAFSRKWWSLTLYFFVVTASHPLLDMLTDGGSGVALFAPFDASRYLLPWRPLPAAPLGLRFFSRRGVEVMASELVWIWIPAILLVAAVVLYRKLRAARK